MTAERIYRDHLRRLSAQELIARYDRAQRLAHSFPLLEWHKVHEDFQAVAAVRGIDLVRAVRTELVLPRVQWFGP